MKKTRPPRLYRDARGRYIKLNGKRIYIKSMMNNKQLVKVVINNFQKRKRKNRKKMSGQKTADLEKLNNPPNNDLAKLMFHVSMNQKDRERIQQPVPPLPQPAAAVPPPPLDASGESQYYQSMITEFKLQIIKLKKERDKLYDDKEPYADEIAKIFDKQIDYLQNEIAQLEGKKKKPRYGEFKLNASNRPSLAKLARHFDKTIPPKGPIEDQVALNILRDNLSADDYDSLKNISANKFKKRVKELLAEPTGRVITADDYIPAATSSSTPSGVSTSIGSLYSTPVRTPLLKSQDTIDRENREMVEEIERNEKHIHDELSSLRDTPSRVRRPLTPFPQPIKDDEFQEASEAIPTSPNPAVGNIMIHTNVRSALEQEKDRLDLQLGHLERENQRDDISESDKERNLKRIEELKQEIIKLDKLIAHERSQLGIHQKASGNKDGGLYDDQIESVMNNYKQKGYRGVYAIDEVDKIPVSNKMGVVLNLDKHNQPGSHWVALYIDADGDQSVEYYDSFAEDPPESLMKDIKIIVDKINPDTYLKFKINKIKQQSESSDSCGFLAMQFLIDRFNGKPWKECTGWSEVVKSEKKAKQFRTRLKKFGYI